jgi:hypothetical protein
MMTRLEFEAKREWRATIKRGDNIAFVLEGQGTLTGRFYEYSDNCPSDRQPKEMEEEKLCRQLAAGDIGLLKGVIPHIKTKLVGEVRRLL